MKKMLTLTAALLMGLTQSNAQTNSSFLLGPQISVGHSWLNNMDHESFKFSPAIGVGFMYQQTKHWAWSASLMVSHEGYRMEEPVMENGIQRANMHSVNPKYLRFTPKAVYSFREDGVKVKPMIGIGPSVAYKFDEVHWVNGFKMDAKQVFGNGSDDAKAPEMIDDFDYGIDADAGVSVNIMRNAWLNGTIGYYHGLVDVRDIEESENRNVRLNVGLMFGL